MQTFLEQFWDRFPNEVFGNSDVECYDRIIDLHPICPKIWYYLILEHKQRLKKISKKLKTWLTIKSQYERRQYEFKQIVS